MPLSKRERAKAETHSRVDQAVAEQQQRARAAVDTKREEEIKAAAEIADKQGTTLYVAPKRMIKDPHTGVIYKPKVPTPMQPSGWFDSQVAVGVLVKYEMPTAKG